MIIRRVEKLGTKGGIYTVESKRDLCPDDLLKVSDAIETIKAEGGLRPGEVIYVSDSWNHCQYGGN